MVSGDGRPSCRSVSDRGRAPRSARPGLPAGPRAPGPPPSPGLACAGPASARGRCSAAAGSGEAARLPAARVRGVGVGAGSPCRVSRRRGWNPATRLNPSLCRGLRPTVGGGGGGQGRAPVGWFRSARRGAGPHAHGPRGADALPCPQWAGVLPPGVLPTLRDESAQKIRRLCPRGRCELGALRGDPRTDFVVRFTLLQGEILLFVCASGLQICQGLPGQVSCFRVVLILSVFSNALQKALSILFLKSNPCRCGALRAFCLYLAFSGEVLLKQMPVHHINHSYSFPPGGLCHRISGVRSTPVFIWQESCFEHCCPIVDPSRV